MKNVHISITDFTSASRVLKEANSLISKGTFKDIVIIALGNNNVPKFEKVSNHVHVYRIKLLTRNLPKNLFFQIIKYLEFTIQTIYYSYHIKPKVINAHSISALPIASLIKFITNCYLVYDTHELETERNGLFGIKKKLSKIIERKLINYSDLVLVVSESIADWYQKQYKISRPPVIFNAPKERALKSTNFFREELGIKDNQIILLYQGAFLVGRGIDILLDTFNSRTDSDIVIVFMGYGPLESLVKRYSEQHSNIYFYPAVPPAEVLEYTSSADVGISLIENKCLSYYYCMPNKLFEYAMAGLPVIVSNMKDMSNFVISNNMGEVTESLSTDDINTAIDSFLEKDLSEYKKNAYITASRYSWQVQESKMISAYKKMLNIGG